MPALKQEDRGSERCDLGDDKKRLKLGSLKKKVMGVMVNSIKMRSNKRVSNCRFASVSIDDVRDYEEEEVVNAFRKILNEKDLLYDVHDDYHTLLRFLKARKFDIDKAVQMWVDMLNWRKDYGADSILKDFVYDEYEQVQSYYPHGYHGVDKEGRPVLFERLGKVDLFKALISSDCLAKLVPKHKLKFSMRKIVWWRIEWLCRVMELLWKRTGWNRVHSDQEQEEWQQWLRLAEETKLLDSRDRWIWVGDDLQEFSVQAVKKVMRDGRDFSNNFVMKWVSWVPLKCNIMAWRAEMGRLPTTVELQKRSLYVEDKECIMSHSVDECVVYLFIACAVATRVWDVVGSWCRLGPMFAFEVGTA